MNAVHASSVEAVAEGLGLRISSDAVTSVLSNVEYRLRELVQDAWSVAFHARRTYLTPADVNTTLRLRNVEAMFGFSSRDPTRFVRAGGHPDICYVEGPILSVDQAIETPLPRPPVDVGLALHWLAVEGLQPAIPENHPPKRLLRAAPPPRAAEAAATALPSTPASAEARAAGAGLPAASPPGPGALEEAAGGSSGSLALVRAPIRHLLSQELQAYLSRLQAWLEGGSAAQPGPAGDPAGSSSQPPPAKHLETALLCSLSRDAGLGPLAPYLVNSLAQALGQHLQDAPRVARALQASSAALANPHLELGAYLHDLMPCLLTAAVARRVGAQAGPHAHWALRERAAAAVAAAAARHAEVAAGVQATLLRKGLDPGRPAASLVGALGVLCALGPRAARLVLVPRAVELLSRALADWEPGAQPAPARGRQEAVALWGALCRALGGVLAQAAAGEQVAARGPFGARPARGRVVREASPSGSSGRRAPSAAEGLREGAGRRGVRDAFGEQGAGDDRAGEARWREQMRAYAGKFPMRVAEAEGARARADARAGELARETRHALSSQSFDAPGGAERCAAALLDAFGEAVLPYL